MLASSLSLQVYVLLCGAKNLTKNFSILCIELILKSNARLLKRVQRRHFPLSHVATQATQTKHHSFFPTPSKNQEELLLCNRQRGLGVLSVLNPALSCSPEILDIGLPCHMRS